MRELSLSWEKMDDYNRGKKIGYIIGKYGVDVFLPFGAFKGVNTVRALKKANTMCTLRVCAASQKKLLKISEESTKRASIVVQALEKNKILVNSSNVQYHVMQKKHGWDRIITLTGKVEDDFRNVVRLLENEGVISSQYSKQTIDIAKGIVRREHQKTINNYNIRVVFNEYPETGEIFLNDAWVVTKK